MAFMRFSFLSEILGYHTSVNIILPFEMQLEDHERVDQEGKYSVLYLLHGGGGNQDDWIRFSSIERYAEKYGIAVVMPDVSGSSFYTDMVHGYQYFTYLSEELPSVMESYFPIGGSREKRFVAGLSMGGYGSLKWGLLKPEFFSYVADMSGASLVMELFQRDGFQHDVAEGKASMFNRNWGGLQKLEGSISDTAYLLKSATSRKDILPKLYVCIGTEDFSYKYTQSFLKYADELGIDILYEEAKGGHDWDFWDKFIVRFICLCVEGDI